MSIEIKLKELIEFGAEAELMGLSFEECDHMVTVLEANMTSVYSYCQMNLIQAHSRLMRYLIVVGREVASVRSEEVLAYVDKFYAEFFEESQ